MLKFNSTNVTVFIIVIILIIFMCLYRFFPFGKIEVEEVKSFHLSTYSSYINDAKTFDIPARGNIPNKETAIKIAEEIFISIYGYTVNKSKPYIASYDSDNNMWLVCGTLAKNKVGGVPYIIIQKENGKVVSIWHTK